MTSKSSPNFEVVVQANCERFVFKSKRDGRRIYMDPETGASAGKSQRVEADGYK